MFRLTSDIRTESTLIKPTAIKWRSSVDSMTDTCVITLSRRAYQHDLISVKDSGNALIKPGSGIVVKCGYNDNNAERFRGFVTRITVGSPMVIECEGYGSLLQRVYFTKSYKKTTLRQILIDLCAGLPIRISDRCDNVEIINVTFNQAPGQKVLEWVQKELLCTVSFYGNELYAGVLRYGVPGKNVKLRIGYNTANDSDLKRVITTVLKAVTVRSKTRTGGIKRYNSEMHKYDAEKEYNVRAGLSQEYLKRLVKELSAREQQSGQTGTIETFLEPVANKGDTINIIDRRWNCRDGEYFAEAVEGSWDSSGGRQKITLRYITK